MTERAGAEGERAAARELERLGYRLLHRNWRCRLGELDIVADDGGTLVFVEVKTRGSAVHGSPAERVDYRKRARLERLARAFLSFAPRELRERPCRFDVVSVLLNPGGITAVEVIRDAFRV